MKSEQIFRLKVAETSFDPQSKTWSDPNIPPLFHKNVSLGSVLLKALSANPYDVAQICHEDGHEIKNWELIRDSVRVCLNLRELGLREGEVMGAVARNGRYIAPVFFGAWLNGNAVCPLHPTFEKQEIIQGFEIIQPKLVICDKENFQDVQSALRELKSSAATIVFHGEDSQFEGQSIHQLLREHPEESDFVPKHLSDGEKLPATILFTSGTTGPQKAVPSSHAALIYQFQELKITGLGPLLSFSSLFGTPGIRNLIISTLNNITRIIVRRAFDEDLFLEVVKKHRVEIWVCPPHQPQLLLLNKTDLAHHLQTLKLVMSGGGPMPESVIERFPAPFALRYGLTEASSGVSSDGKLSYGVVVKLIDDEGRKLGVGERGEICVKLRFPFLGYYRDPEATKEMLEEDGFLHTGDIGVFDSDGCLHVVDRKKNIFKYRNHQISPTDIEKGLEGLLGQSIVCVVGVPHEVYGALPAACIIRSTEGKMVKEEEIHKFAKENFLDFQWFRGGVYFVNEFPMTNSGKAKRRELADFVAKLYAERPDIGFDY